MASSRPKPIKKIPMYLLDPNDGYDGMEFKLVNSKYEQELNSFFAVDQKVQKREALRYAEQQLRKKNLRLFTPDELYQFIVELHRISAHSLVLLNNQVHSGTFASFRVSMRRETGISDKQFEPTPPFSQHNYTILKQKHGLKVADSYKEFCGAFDASYKTATEVKHVESYSATAFIFAQGLDKHSGFEAYSLINKFGEKPENMEKAMREFCQILSIKLQSESADPFDCAAYALFRLCQIHPFPNGNGTVARILMNCVLMDFGINPIQIGPSNKTEYYHAIENATLGNFDLLKKFIRGNLNKKYSKEEAEPMFPDRGVTFLVEWDPVAEDQCLICPGYYIVTSDKNVNKYRMFLMSTGFSSSEISLEKFLKIDAARNKTQLFIIDESYCEEKGKVHEAIGNLQVAVYYFQRAAAFCLVAEKEEQAKRLFEQSEKLRLKLLKTDSLTEGKGTTERKSATPLPTPYKISQNTSIDVVLWQELKAILDKKRKAKNAADKAKIRERLVAVMPKLVFDKGAIESVGLSLSQVHDFLNGNEAHCTHIGNYSDLLRKISDAIAGEKKTVAERKDAAFSMGSRLYSIAGINIAVPALEEDKKMDRVAALNASVHPACLFYMPPGTSLDAIVAHEKNPQATIHPARFVAKKV